MTIRSVNNYVKASNEGDYLFSVEFQSAISARSTLLFLTRA